MSSTDLTGNTYEHLEAYYGPGKTFVVLGPGRANWNYNHNESADRAWQVQDIDDNGTPFGRKRTIRERRLTNPRFYQLVTEATR